MREGQKYVLGLRFVGFGDMTIVDIVSLSMNYHKEIAFEHAKNMGWLPDEFPKNKDKFAVIYQVPVMFAGGYVKETENRAIEFFGSSSDFTEVLLGENVNILAGFTASTCGFTVSNKNESGADFFEDMLKCMLKYKLQDNFYEQVVAHYINKKFTAQQIGGLITMKVLDRWTRERKDIIQLLVEECAYPFGLAKFFLLMAAAKKSKEQENSQE